MRQITADAVRAFRNNQNFKRGNTEVDIDGAVDYQGKPMSLLLLHGNTIAELSNGGMFISSCGWQTVTTKERLNGLPGVHIEQRNFEWFLNGEYWDGGRIKI
jgi:hypothetical protein